MFELNRYTDAKCEQVSARRLTVLENLKQQQVELTARLERCTKAIEALEKNPEFTNCLELVQQAL